MGTNGTSGVLNGRFNSGCVRRRTHTPALTSAKASSVPTLVISSRICRGRSVARIATKTPTTMELIYGVRKRGWILRSEEHTSELQSHSDLVCRLLLEKKKDR